MINLQPNKKHLLKTYDEFYTELAKRHKLKSSIHSLYKSPYMEKIIQSNYIQYVLSPPHNYHQSKIEFPQPYLEKNSQQTKFKTKIYPIQKPSSKKKRTLSNYQKNSKQQVTYSDSTFLTIGSHAIRKMDYTAALMTRQFKFMQENTTLRNRLRSYNQQAGIKSSTQLDKSSNVLVLERNHNHSKISEQILMSFNGPVSERKIREQISKQPKRTGKSSRIPKEKAPSIQDFIPLKKITKKQPFIFGLAEKQGNQQKLWQKFVNYHDFLWKVNYSNGLYVKPSKDDVIYKAYVGSGNNSNLIKSIISRRFWWGCTEKVQDCHFIWTQLKIKSIYKDQSSCKTRVHNIYRESFEAIREEHTDINLSQKIFNKVDEYYWGCHLQKNYRLQSQISPKTYKNRLNLLNRKNIIKIESSEHLKVHNHLPQNCYIGNKKALYYNMKRLYETSGSNVFQALPLTFHIAKGIEDPQFKYFIDKFDQFERTKQKGHDIKNIWIIKPGQSSNRGNGITVCYSLEDIKIRIKGKQRNSDGSLRTFIVQKYIQRPLLYKGRKFDIRHYLLLTCFNGILKAYWFEQGYIRTSSSTFNLKRGTNLYVHLTNDAVQKHSQQYGKYEKGNKISYQRFNQYLAKCENGNAFYNNILPEMKKLSLQAVKATYFLLDPQKKSHNFELLGMDFMIDQNLKPWLIQINTNPCLQMSSPLLAKIIPTLVQQTFRICIDPLFPPPEDWPAHRKTYTSEDLIEQNKFELIFDQSIEGQPHFDKSIQLDKNMGKIDQDAEVFENQGEEEWQNIKNDD